MCGILGTYDINGLDEFLIKSQLDIINFRGPDNSDYYINDNVAIGSNRLSIRDISNNGNMPLKSTCGKYIIVFNGEIYNSSSLRQDLLNSGFRFKGTSDTEVLLNLYIKHRNKCLKYLSGMFSFCIYNIQENLFFIARDRTGEKPFYYYSKSGNFTFASQLNQLLLDPKINKKIDRKSLFYYLENGYSPRDSSLIKDVKKLAPGHSLTFKIISGEIVIDKYWEISNQKEDYLLDEQEIIDNVDSLLNSSVQETLVSDVSVGVLLSGGIDSSLVSYYSSINKANINTFNVSFGGFSKYDESEQALKVAKFLGTNHHEFNGNSIKYDLIELLAHNIGEPIADSSLLATYMVYNEIGKKSTVVLGGDGGDELFGGYSNYTLSHDYEEKNKLFKTIAQKLPIGTPGKNRYLKTNSNGLLAYKYFNPIDIQKLFNFDIYSKVKESTLQFPGDFLKSVTLEDFKNYLTEDILVKIDRASMMNSIESRSPFLNKDLIEFAFNRIPSSIKIVDGRKKSILKKLLKQKVEVEFDFDKKQGFSIPLDNWAKNGWYNSFKDDINNLPEGFNKDYILKMLFSLKLGFKNSNNLFAIIMLSKSMNKHSITL